MKGKRAALLALSLFLTGCQSQTSQRILEKLGVISAVGFDLQDGDILFGTYVIPNFTETGGEKIDVLTATGHTSKELRFNMSRQSERKLVSGQIRAVLYGEDLARKGLLPISDTLFRDAEIGSQIHLAVVQGEARDFFQKRYPDKPSIDLYLYRMMRKEMEENTIPKSNLHLFIHDAYGVGKDPVLPYLRLGKEDVIVDGVAVFHNDKMVGRIKAEEARLLAYMEGRKSIGELDVEVQEKTSNGEKAHAVMMYMDIGRKLTVAKANGKPSFHFDVTIRGAITEYTGFQDLEQMPVVKKLEQTFQQNLQERIQHVMDKLQKDFQSDPLGLGELYRSKGFVPVLEQETWYKQYAEAKIDVKVNVTILQTGMIH
ncbi:spore germination protein [Tumebacillus sp. BK434]|uniref:Ger(x)C family spore germination protein n=1 Tax=Tumebacillus sp. BK434 TaxID=2512169 RepID=UPI00104893EE|nr:Ger(x)C family spore germination protein [Tumebacillus sp. BK434]TCP54677.1 spore germination protein [Tumebacillus sp. BK434]